jgi:hypothetical protein
LGEEMTQKERKLLDKLRLWVVLHPEKDWQRNSTCEFCSEGPLNKTTTEQCDKSGKRVWINEELTQIKIGKSKEKMLELAKKNYICCGWLIQDE